MDRLLAPLIVVGGGFGLLLTACGIAWVYEKTRKKIEHPSLGTLTFQGDSWIGLRAHFRQGQPAIRFELPGDKDGPEFQSVDRFEQLWASLEKTLAKIRPAALEEFDEIKDCCDDPDHLELVADIEKHRLDNPEEFDKHWILSEIGLLAGSRPYWDLEFEVAWDIEHSRSACLDLDGRLLIYTLSCALGDPYDS